MQYKTELIHEAVAVCCGVDYKLRRKVNYSHLTSHVTTACSPKPTTFRMIVNRKLMIFMTHLMISIRALSSFGVSAGLYRGLLLSSIEQLRNFCGTFQAS